MKVLWMLIVLALLLQGCAGLRGPRDPWTKTDTALQLTYSALHIMDWSQTLHGARNPEKYYEVNPLMGKHPSEGRVNSYMAFSLLATTSISYYLPKPERTWWQSLLIGVKVYLINHNQSVGIDLKF